MKIECLPCSLGSTLALAKALDVSEEFLQRVAANPSDFYSISEIPKKSGGFRIITDPVKELKLIQRRIIRRIFSKVQFPDYLFGSVKDQANPRDFVRNVQYHSDAKNVVSFDIESFFPSVKARYIKKVYKYLLRVPDEVAIMLVALTTLEDALPQGAPTSSYLANLIFYDSEHKLVQTLRAKGWKYSRLVDDITISASGDLRPQHRSFIYDLIRKFLAEKNLSISKKKYAVTNTETHGKKTVVTGLVIERGIVKLPREKVKRIGWNVHALSQKALVDTTDSGYHSEYESLSGVVALYQRLDPVKASSYRAILRASLPTYSPQKVKKVASLCRTFIDFSKKHPDRLETEGYVKKYYKFRHRLNIVTRTKPMVAKKLRDQMLEIAPSRRLSEYYE